MSIFRTPYSGSRFIKETVEMAIFVLKLACSELLCSTSVSVVAHESPKNQKSKVREAI